MRVYPFGTRLSTIWYLYFPCPDPLLGKSTTKMATIGSDGRQFLLYALMWNPYCILVLHFCFLGLSCEQKDRTIDRPQEIRLHLRLLSPPALLSGRIFASSFLSCELFKCNRDELLCSFHSRISFWSVERESTSRLSYWLVPLRGKLYGTHVRPCKIIRPSPSVPLTTWFRWIAFSWRHLVHPVGFFPENDDSQWIRAQRRPLLHELFQFLFLSPSACLLVL